MARSLPSQALIDAANLAENEGCACPAEDRLAKAAAENFQFIWRTLRRLGVKPDSAVDDAVQEVFEVAARKRALIEPGRERGFLFKTALLVAAEMRRDARTLREVPDEDVTLALSSDAPSPEQALSERQRRELLDQVLQSLDITLRTVFVLFELEGMTSLEIAKLLELPSGTVASRLRRAREEFQAQVRRLRAQTEFVERRS